MWRSSDLDEYQGWRSGDQAQRLEVCGLEGGGLHAEHCVLGRRTQAAMASIAGLLGSPAKFLTLRQP